MSKALRKLKTCWKGLLQSINVPLSSIHTTKELLTILSQWIEHNEDLRLATQFISECNETVFICIANKDLEALEMIETSKLPFCRSHEEFSEVDESDKYQWMLDCLYSRPIFWDGVRWLLVNVEVQRIYLVKVLKAIFKHEQLELLELLEKNFEQHSNDITHLINTASRLGCEHGNITMYKWSNERRYATSEVWMQPYEPLRLCHYYEDEHEYVRFLSYLYQQKRLFEQEIHQMFNKLPTDVVNYILTWL